jgi:hypothetical protein
MFDEQESDPTAKPPKNAKGKRAMLRRLAQT